MNRLEKSRTTEAPLTRREEPAEDDDIVHQIVDTIGSVRFGQPQITTQESGIVHIDKTKKGRVA